jgi:hypothetical protein
MKLNKFWYACDDDYVMNQLKRDGVKAPELVAGVPFSELIDLARKGDGIVEWVASGGYLVYMMGPLDSDTNFLGSRRGWGNICDQKAIYVNFKHAAADKYVDIMKTMDTCESANISDGFNHRVYKVPIF